MLLYQIRVVPTIRACLWTSRNVFFESLVLVKIWIKLRYRSHSFFKLNNWSIFIHMSPYLYDPFSIMRGPRELLFFQLVVLLHRSKRHSNSFWTHRMFEVSSHKVTSILRPSQARIWTIFLQFFCKNFQVSSRSYGDWESWYLGGLVVLLGTTYRRTIGFWAHCMF